MQRIFAHPFLSYAFRPFYTAAALWGIIALILWVGGFQGVSPLSGFLWHAHEMIWGYSAAIIVGFLLTAVATWTGQKPLCGAPLLLLLLWWLLARGLIFIPDMLGYATFFSVLFYTQAIFHFSRSIIASGNRRNYVAIVALCFFALSYLGFMDSLLGSQFYRPLNALFAGVLMIAAFIGFIGLRVIPFFTARRLGIPQVAIAKPFMLAALFLPTLAALSLFWQQAPWWLFSLLIIVSGSLNLFQWRRIWHRGILKEPLLWILFLGFALTALGLIAWGMSHLFAPAYESAALHIITLGGIGLMTLGMMTRTALGHTGRALVLPRPLKSAYLLMVFAVLLRPLAIFGGAWYFIGVHAAATLFVLALVLFLYRYLPYLWRADRRQQDKNILKIIR